jgi:GAF domain-containing protein
MSTDMLRSVQQENQRLQEENRRLREEVYSLRHYVEAASTLVGAIDSLDPGDEIVPLLDRALYIALTVIDAKDGSLMVLDEETGELVFVLAHGDVEQGKLIGVRLPPGEGIAGWVAKQGKPAIVNDARRDPRFLPIIDEVFDFVTESILAAPIACRGRMLGVIEVLNKHSGQAFSPGDQVLLQLLCRFAGEILDRLSAEGGSAPQAGQKTPPKVQRPDA